LVGQEAGAGLWKLGCKEVECPYEGKGLDGKHKTAFRWKPGPAPSERFNFFFRRAQAASG
jgi:hypothetical protein